MIGNLDIQEEPGTSVNTNITEKERRAKLAAEKRAKIMAQMAAQQKNFIKENAKLFENTSMDVQPEKVSDSSYDMDITEVQTIALGPNQSSRLAAEKSYTCILCQEEERITADGPAMVLAAFVQQATVLNKSLKDDTRNPKPNNNNPLYLNSMLSPAPHTNTCGHVMHSDCWRKFFNSVMVREHRRSYRSRHPSSFDVEKQEFLCPLCQCLSNTVLPVVPSLNKIQPSLPVNELPFQDFLSSLKYVMIKKNKVCHGMFKCNMEECRNIHCTACINASSGTRIAQESRYECEMNWILKPHEEFYSTSVDMSDVCLSQRFIDLFIESQVELNSHLQEMIEDFPHVTYMKGLNGLNVPPHPSDKRLVPSAWKSLAYTTHAIETVTNYQGKPLLGSLTSRQRDSLENLVKVVAVLGSTWSEVLKSHALNLLSILFDLNEDETSILDVDPFGFLVALTFSVPSLLVQDSQTPVSTGGTLEWHSVRLIFILNIVKIFFSIKASEVTAPKETRTNDEIINELLMAVAKWVPDICATKVWDCVKECSRPFLRRCVLFYHYLTEVPAPNCLREAGGDTFENMCAYLDLPTTPHDLLDNEIIQDLVKKWTSHSDVVSFNKDSDTYYPKELQGAPRLMELPDDYSELINSVSTFVCPNSEEECRNPTMCLVCGLLLCSQSYCCQTEYNKIPVGACNSHATVCGAGIGIFLRIRDCELLLLATPHMGCFMSPPYLDEHGETDQGLRRGNPLKLNHERYEKLHMMWLNHSIHEEIARQIETSTHIVTTQWNML